MQVAMPDLLAVRLGCVAQLFSFVVNISGWRVVFHYNMDVRSRPCGERFVRARGKCLGTFGCCAFVPVGRCLLLAVFRRGFGFPSPLSCEAVLLEWVCVSLGVRVSGAAHFRRVEFEDCVFHC